MIFLACLMVAGPGVLGSLLGEHGLVGEDWLGEGRGRQLLQAEGEEGEEMGESPLSTTTKEPETTTPFDKENQAGPTEFYFANGRLPKLLMMVEEGIRVTIFEHGSPLDTFVLDQVARGGISGSKLDPDAEELQVDIDYKGQKFTGLESGQEITGLQLEMKFEATGSNMWVLAQLKIVGLGFKGAFLEEDLDVVSGMGYKVEAPIGLAWCCDDAGMFHPRGNSTLSAGIQFPDLRLQVFEVNLGEFGPIWECGEMITIGLLTGLLVTLGFAMICTWGFTMLANINTMDRFDDPKGPSIHVPNTD